MLLLMVQDLQIQEQALKLSKEINNKISQ